MELPKRTDDPRTKLRIASLKELDALVGQYLVNETPQIFWEEEHACLRFDSINEALDAMRDPYFQLFIPPDARPHTALKEVKEFRPYSTELNLAWEVVERMSPKGEPLRIRSVNGQWLAAFGDRTECASRSAPVAICLAALQVNGLEVEIDTEDTGSPGEHRAVA